MGLFYGTLQNEKFLRQLKDSRNIEELILKFSSDAANLLKKDQSLSGGGWTPELDKHIALFVQLIRECLRGLSHVPPELTQRLDTYAIKFTPQQQSSTAYSDSGYDSGSTNRDRDSVGSPNRKSRNIVDMSLVLTVARLFKIPEHNLQAEVDNIGKFCTEKVDPACPRMWITLTG